MPFHPPGGFKFCHRPNEGKADLFLVAKPCKKNAIIYRRLQRCTLQLAILQGRNQHDMRISMGTAVLILIILLLDTYIFQAIKMVSRTSAPVWRYAIYGIYWFITAATVGLVLSLPFLGANPSGGWWTTHLLASLIGIVIAKMLALLFLLTDDLRRVVQWLVAQFWSRNSGVPHPGEGMEAEAISRSVFLSWLGLAAGGALFGALVYGFRNKYNYQVRRVKLHFGQLPQSFAGFKIVQISDIHSGSLLNPEAVKRGVDLIIAQQPDLILFTGDLVNDRAEEMEPYIQIFGQLKAPMGVYSILGNHDYGDYYRWPSIEAKKKNLQQLIQIHANMGWQLLMDEGVRLEKHGEEIALLGVQNISGKGRFHSYGNLHQAWQSVKEVPFKILMSHDPSHWESGVLPSYSDIALMLSGHTHGMQFGVEWSGFKWSPVQWMYRQWAGLYEKDGQMLYVNRGFGFIGYPGRVGILPEITVIELA